MGAPCRCRATCRWPTTACASWMHGPSSAAMSSRFCASRSRRVSDIYNFGSVIDLTVLTAIAARVVTRMGSRETR